jgi:hypothetical protein
MSVVHSPALKRHKVGKMMLKGQLPAACEFIDEKHVNYGISVGNVALNCPLLVTRLWGVAVFQLFGIPCRRTQSTQSDPNERLKKKIIFYDFHTRQHDLFQCDRGYTPSPSDVENVQNENENVRAVGCVKIAVIHLVDCNNTKLILQFYKRLAMSAKTKN